ncbi:MAG: FMN-binding protein [Spirochaetaceae bacterium]
MTGLGRAMALTAALFGVVLLFVGCMSAENLARHLDSISVVDPDFSALAAGTYDGEYDIDLPPGAWAANHYFRVDLEVAGGTATGIKIHEPKAFSDDDAFAAYNDRILEAQSLQVDAISGATISSKAFVKAVEDAATPE